jgi:hypothetical protein
MAQSSIVRGLTLDGPGIQDSTPSRGRLLRSPKLPD